MQMHLSGHHVEVTPALRSYVEKKLARILRHCDQLIDVQCTLTVEKLQHKAESTVHLRGASIHAAAIDSDMYAAIDVLADKLDEQVKRHKGKVRAHHTAHIRNGLEAPQ